MFLRTLDKYTRDHKVLVFDQSAKGNRKIVDRFFWFKATEPPPFRMGMEKLWQTSTSLEKELPTQYDGHQLHYRQAARPPPRS